MLFPSFYFSDGEPRGDFHTGSNISAWYAFASMARIASEIYRDDVLANEWQTTAGQIQESIDTHCVGDSVHGRRFFEGANADGSFVPGHDGEETETTLLPFYGYCNADDPRLRTHAALALSDENPLYSKELDAIWWYNSDWGSATFPSWLTALAAAGDDASLRYRLQRIRRLTDLDGSVWWWPYRYGSGNALHPLRGDVARKCGWGGAVYACKLVNDVLGITCDTPLRRLECAPFLPWNRFSWKGMCLGTSRFDIEYRSSEDESTLSIRNQNSNPFTVSATLIPRCSKNLITCTLRVVHCISKAR